ncbi:MAG: hypothetical protein HY706_17935 [Candidatus Hydrogenedentes bacterium]|nr:hypothetical protein [Candidatus Hydrogenedentota bacterium]
MSVPPGTLLVRVYTYRAKRKGLVPTGQNVTAITLATAAGTAPGTPTGPPGEYDFSLTPGQRCTLKISATGFLPYDEAFWYPATATTYNKNVFLLPPTR